MIQTRPVRLRRQGQVPAAFPALSFSRRQCFPVRRLARLGPTLDAVLVFGVMRPVRL